MSTKLTTAAVQVRSTVDVRADFPMLVNHPELKYLDTAATAQVPTAVLEAQQAAYENFNAPIHRTLYTAGMQATQAYENVRQHVATFMNAATPESIIFTTNATHGLNLVAHIVGQQLQPGDEIVLSVAEHHSNILPWQQIAARTGVKLTWVNLNASNCLDLADLKQKITPATKVVALHHISNVTGAVVPLVEVVEIAHQAGAVVVVDAAQSVGRLPIDVQTLDVDYLVASGHKMYGPGGTGWAYIKTLPGPNVTPLLTGGGTIERVTQTQATWAAGPTRFEGGTPNAPGIIGLGAAVTYLTNIGLDAMWQHEQELTEYLLEELARIDGLTVYGPGMDGARVGIISFSLNVGGNVVHSHDVVTLLNKYDVAVRGGQLCAEPLLTALGVADLNRISLGVYSSRNDVDAVIQGLKAVQTVFARGHKKGATKPSL